MSDTIRVFVNAGAVNIPAGADVEAAVRAFDPELERQIAGGTAYVTDGRGIRVSPASSVSAGAILRVVVSARRSENADADA